MKRLLAESRLVTLTGPGGVGKTRLALRVGAELRRNSPDGVWLVTLAELSDPGLLTQAVAAALGVEDYSRQGLTVTMEEFLRGKSLLLVMDNCEHLVDSCAALVNAILPVTPQVRVLATSRQSLGVSGEQVLQVPPLSVPDLPCDSSGQAPPTCGELVLSEAVELFTDRAHAVLPSFTLTPENGRAVVEICRRLDGIPLALELAAVRLRALSAEQILQRLDDRFRLLTGGDRAAVSRQQTLRALIDWSHEHCTEAERALWERASVFSGGFNLAAAEQVCAGDGIAAGDMLHLVDALVDKSIFSAENRNGETRYRMLETIRQYAHDKLTASGQETVLRRRHRDYFQSVAEAAALQWFGPDQPIFFSLLRREHANMRVALDFCVSEPGEAQTGLTIASGIYWFFWLGYLSEGRRWLDRALALAPEPTQARATALWSNAWLTGQQGDFAAVRMMAEECRTLARQLGDRPGVAAANGAAGWAAMCEGDLASASALLEEALAEHIAVDDVLWIMHDKSVMAVMAALSGDTDRAVALCEASRAICDAHGDLWNRAWIALCQSWVMWRRGDRPHAEEFARECLRTNRELDDRLDLACSLEALAWVAAADDPERAARLLGVAQASLEAIGAPIYPFMQSDHERCVAATRAVLGEKAFTTAFQAGAALTIEEAIAEAMNEERQKKPVAGVVAGQDKSTPLTPREKEVATLVADGLTNKQIAERLVISPRTAEGHIEHIMTKLGFTRRTQIAAFMVETSDAV